MPEPLSGNSLPKCVADYAAYLARTLDPASLQQLLEEFRNDWAPATRESSSLATFVESTTTQFLLEQWQSEICARLQVLPDQQGQRVLIHGAPQFGKSIIISQRFPAWSIGKRPDLRFRLACYNETHAERFSRVNLAVMRDPTFGAAFPGCGLPPVGASVREWSTPQRAAQRDGQPSFVALGIGSGFVGMGADLLVIDDPYKDREQAYSDTTNENVWLWWTSVVLPRLNPATNVVVMFHRWRSNDLAGRLMEQGGWELLRYPAIADGLPGDCSGLPPGTALSPRFSVPFLRNVEVQQGKTAFSALYQGLPGDTEGNLIQAQWFRTWTETEDAYLLPRSNGRVDRVPKADCWFFATGDWASSEAKTADWTVVPTWAVTPRRDLLLMARARGREEGPEAKELARKELRRWQPAFAAFEKNGLGLPMTQDLEREGWTIRGVWQHRAKEARAQALASAYEQGRIFHPTPEYAPWLGEWTSELLAFPRGGADDQVDTGSLAVRCVAGLNTVITDFSASFHVGGALEVDSRYALALGWAIEPFPACVVAQVVDQQLRVLLAWVAATGEGVEPFVCRIATEIQARYCPEGVKVGDLRSVGFAPGGWIHGPKGTLGALFAQAGGGTGSGLVPVGVVTTREELDETIRQRCRGLHQGQPTLILDGEATELITALSGDYAYKVNQQGRPTPEVEKNASAALALALGLVCHGAAAVRNLQDPIEAAMERQRAATPAYRVAGARGR